MKSAVLLLLVAVATTNVFAQHGGHLPHLDPSPGSSDEIPHQSYVYPFGAKYGDKIMDYDAHNGTTSGSLYITLSNSFPFGTSSYKGLYLYSAGVITFKKDSIPANESAICGPSHSKHHFHGLAPFLTTVRYEPRSNSKVYYRETNDLKLLQQASAAIVSSFPLWEDLKLTRLFIATWQEMRPVPEHACSNTFQAVLATDGTFSFAIYNYIQLEWPGQRVCRDAPKAVRVGFFNREHDHELPLSCQMNVTELQRTSNVNVPGQYMFRIDNAGQNFWDFFTYYGSFWVWTGIFLAFVLGMMSALCCVACCSCCTSSKNNKKRQTRSQNRHRDDSIHVHVTSPPHYSPYPDDLMPPKY